MPAKLAEADQMTVEEFLAFIATPVKGLAAKPALPAIAAKIPLRDIYRWTPID